MLAGDQALGAVVGGREGAGLARPCSSPSLHRIRSLKWPEEADRARHADRRPSARRRLRRTRRRGSRFHRIGGRGRGHRASEGYTAPATKIKVLLTNLRNALVNSRKMTVEVDQLFHHRGNIILCQGTKCSRECDVRKFQGTAPGNVMYGSSGEQNLEFRNLSPPWSGLSLLNVCLGFCRQLHRDPNVLFAGYKLPHPLQHKIIVRIHTASQSSPTQAYTQAINDLDKELENIKQDFEFPWRPAAGGKRWRPVTSRRRDKQGEDGVDSTLAARRYVLETAQTQRGGMARKAASVAVVEFFGWA